MMCATLRAIPFPDMKWQPLENESAGMTPFTGWEESISEANPFSIHAAFVFDHCTKGAQRSIGQTKGQSVIPDHIPYRQVLHADHVKPAHQAGRDFMQAIHAAVGYPGVEPSNPKALSIPSAATLYSPGKNALSSGESRTFIGQEAGIGDSFPVGERCQAVDAQVYPDHLSGLRRMFHWFVEAQCHEIAPGTILGYRNCGWHTRELSGPTDFQSADLGYCEIPVLFIPLEGTAGVFSALLPAFRFERGIVATLLKEGPEACLKMPEDLLGWNAGNLIQPGMVILLLEQRQFSRGFMVANGLACLIRIGPQAQTPIIDVPASPERPGQRTALLVGGIETESVANLHIKNLTHVTTCNKKKGEAQFLYRLQAAVSLRRIL